MDFVDDERLTIEQQRLISSWEIYSRDTAPDIERRRLALARKAPPWRKLWLAADMSQAVRALTLAGLRHRYPKADEDEIRLRLAVLLFGAETAKRLCGKEPDGEPHDTA